MLVGVVIESKSGNNILDIDTNDYKEAIAEAKRFFQKEKIVRIFAVLEGGKDKLKSNVFSINNPGGDYVQKPE